MHRARTPCRRRRPHPIQHLHETIRGRETEYRYNRKKEAEEVFLSRLRKKVQRTKAWAGFRAAYFVTPVMSEKKNGKEKINRMERTKHKKKRKQKNRNTEKHGKYTEKKQNKTNKQTRKTKKIIK